MFQCFVMLTIAMGLSVTPSGRFAHNSIVHENQVWIVGGSESGGPSPHDGNNGQRTVRGAVPAAEGTIAQGIWKYSPTRNKWSYSDVEFPERRGATLVKHNKHVYLHGGGIVDPSNGFKSIPTADLWCYKRGSWRSKGPAPPLYCHQSVVSPKGFIYSIGGMDENGLSNKMYIYDGEEWTTHITPFKHGIMGHTATITDEGVIFVIGGVFGSPTDEDNYNADVWSYSIATSKWNLESGGLRIHGHSACKFTRTRAIGRAAFHDDDIVTVGGFFPTTEATNSEGATHLDGTVQNIYSWNVYTRMWKYRGEMSKPREFCSAVGFNKNKLFIFGGYHIGNFWDDAEVVQLN